MVIQGYNAKLIGTTVGLLLVRMVVYALMELLLLTALVHLDLLVKYQFKDNTFIVNATEFSGTRIVF